MVGQIGTNGITAVAVSNQLILMYMVTIGGALAGAGIFTAQYFGNNDLDKVRKTFRAKILLSLSITLLASVLLFIYKGQLVNLFLSDDNSPENIFNTRGMSFIYINIMVIGLFPYSISHL